ncbi:agmatinase family protein [Terricaulis silvestris]|uniref:Formimidoylglutamase n=1 Tax=Terricaulis silvestris TaxID=2686094 RepID=A0A6I6MRC7_9CAUL|nr:agmatinase family protein [Terricaulis silvestris]QGZ96701.1 Formimidoylglutamase [Terricaulis silvestris]
MNSDSDCRSWFSAADLLTQDGTAPVALIGAPLGLGSITPGRCDLAPETVRAAMKRMSVYDLETETDLSSVRIFDAGDIGLERTQPAEAFAPIVETLMPLTREHQLTIVLGGNNAVTRPCVHALDAMLQRVGVLTLDAHFDLRDTDCGLTNGNPIQALLEDGLPGAHIAQIGLLPFANTRKAHDKAKSAGIYVATAAACKAQGLAVIAENALARLAAKCDVIHVDFDIDVVERSAMPGASGARPGGVGVQDFFDATRFICAHPKVRSVDLTEFDPSLDVAAISALTAARWVCEALAGYQKR